MSLSDAGNIAQILGFVLYAIVTLINEWPKMIAREWNWQKLALGFLIIALLGSAVSYVVPYITKTETVREVKSDVPLKRIYKKKFINERVPLDGYSYVECHFVNVTLEYNGGLTEMINSTMPVGTSLKFVSNNKGILKAMEIFRILGIVSPNVTLLPRSD